MSSCAKGSILRRVSFILIALALLSLFISGCSTSDTSRRNQQQSDADRLNSMIGRVTRADIVQHLGPPNRTMNMDGDDFFFYTVTVRNRTLDIADALSGAGAGAQGRDYTPAPRPQQTYILRFDGQTDLLKGWNVR